MKNLIFILFILINSISYSQDKDDLANGIDFFAKGDNAEWSLKIDMDKEIIFASEKINITTGVPSVKDIFLNKKPLVVKFIWGTMRARPDGIQFSAKTGKFKIKVKAMRDTTDSKNSVKEFPYLITVKITNVKKNKSKVYSGCGKFYADSRLEQIWITKKINGEDFKNSKYSELKCSITFNIKRNTASGYSGCNSYSYDTEVRGSVIAFCGITMTLMACDNLQDETKFFQALSGKDLDYIIEKDRLFFIYKGETVLEFQHEELGK
jgi:heat shock protein HslJ